MYMSLGRKPEGKRPLGKPSRRWKERITKSILKEAQSQFFHLWVLVTETMDRNPRRIRFKICRDTTPCRLVNVYQRYGGRHRLLPRNVVIHQPTRRHMLAD
jgi:hypothetical protein